MSDNSPPMRVMDVIPREVLNQPFTKQDTQEAHERFLKVGGLIASIGAGALVLFLIATFYAFLLASFLIFLLGIFPFLVGLAMFLGLFLTYDEYKEQRDTRKNQGKTHDDVKRAVINIVATIQYNQYNIAKGATFVNGASAPPLDALPFPSVTPETPSINETYELALKITKVGLEAWNVNGGKRPTEKPFSAVKMKEYLGIGSEKWQEVIGLISDSHVMSRPDSKTWTPNAKDMGEAKSLLDKYLVSQGYYLNRNGRVETWMKV